MAEAGSDAHAAALAALRSALLGQSPRFERNDGYWRAHLGSAWIQTGAWRLVTKDGIILTSEDEGHQFGLPQPVDAQTEANARMASGPVTDITITPFAGDLALHLADLKLEFLVTSASYESWEANFTHAGLDYLIVCNGGRLSAHSHPAGEKPSIIHGGPWKVA